MMKVTQVPVQATAHHRAPVRVHPALPQVLHPLLPLHLQAQVLVHPVPHHRVQALPHPLHHRAPHHRAQVTVTAIVTVIAILIGMTQIIMIMVRNTGLIGYNGKCIRDIIIYILCAVILRTCDDLYFLLVICL